MFNPVNFLYMQIEAKENNIRHYKYFGILFDNMTTSREDDIPDDISSLAYVYNFAIQLKHTRRDQNYAFFYVARPSAYFKCTFKINI